MVRRYLEMQNHQNAYHHYPLELLLTQAFRLDAVSPRSILDLAGITMTTKFDNQRFAVGKVLLRSDDANDYVNRLVTLINEHKRILRYTPGLMTALTQAGTEEALGVVSNGSENLRDKLPSKVGEHKAISWTVRTLHGESVAQVTQGTHSTVTAVQQAVDVTTPYIGFSESSESEEDTSTE